MVRDVFLVSLAAVNSSLWTRASKLRNFGEDVPGDGWEGGEVGVVEGGRRVGGGQVGDLLHSTPGLCPPVGGREGQAVVCPGVVELEVDRFDGEELAVLTERDVLDPDKPVRGGDEGGDATHLAVQHVDLHHALCGPYSYHLAVDTIHEDVSSGRAGPAGQGQDVEHVAGVEQSCGLEKFRLQEKRVSGLCHVAQSLAGLLPLAEQPQLPPVCGPQGLAPGGGRPPQRELPGEQLLRPECLQLEGVDRQVTWATGASGH